MTAAPNAAVTLIAGIGNGKTTRRGRPGLTVARPIGSEQRGRAHW